MERNTNTHKEQEFRYNSVPYYDVVKLLSLVNRDKDKIDRQVFRDIVYWMIRRNSQLERYRNNREELLIDIKDAATDFREIILEIVNEHLMEDTKEVSEVDKLIEDKNLTIEELRKFCGGVSRPTIDKWVKNGLKSYKVSGRVFFKLSEVQEYLSNHERK
jgi:predicted DNA-binding transcriptional regulator AlpA